jgi:gliding motility-associated-like protein
VAGLAAGTYTVTVTNANGCSISDTIVIHQPLPVTIQAIPDSAQIKLGESINVTTTYSDNVQGNPVYIWQPSVGLNCSDCPNPVATPEFTTVYQVTLIDQAGCMATDQVLIEVDLDKTFYVPNAFTPNGNGTNDVFQVYTNGARNIHLMIFNRWGEKIFESFDLNKGWDGTYQDRLLNPSVYVYYVEITYLDGSKKTAKGSVTLIL